MYYVCVREIISIWIEFLLEVENMFSWKLIEKRKLSFLNKVEIKTKKTFSSRPQANGLYKMTLKKCPGNFKYYAPDN